MNVLRRPVRLALVLVAVVALVAVPTFAYAETLSWTRQYYGPADIPNPTGDDIPVAARFDAVDMLDASTGIAVGTWTDTPLQTSAPKTSLAAFTSDGGSHWTTAAPAPMGTELYGTAMKSASEAFAVTSYGGVLRWSGGAWTALTVSGWPTSGSRALRGIVFTDATHGWAVGDLGGVAKTEDGGLTWTTVIAPTTGQPVLRAVTRLSASSCVAVGDSGSIRMIGSSGVTSVSSPTSKALYSVAFRDTAHGVAVGAEATVLKTSDGGDTWTAATLPITAGLSAASAKVLSVEFGDALNGMACGTYMQVWRTCDGGDTWTLSRITLPSDSDDLELRSVAFAPGSPTHPVIVGASYSGQITHNADKARAFLGDWTGQTPPPLAAPSSVTVADAGAPGPRATVSWSGGPAAADGYEIRRGVWPYDGTVIATVGPDASSWTDTGVDWGTLWKYSVRSFRGAERSAWTSNAEPFRVDSNPPATTSDAQLTYQGPAAIHLAATDAQSGVDYTEFYLDDVYARGTVVGTSDAGQHTLRFRSVDVVGNAEPWHEVSFWVTAPAGPDTTPPVTTIVGGAYAYYAAPANISIVATDAGGSGVLTTFLRINSGSIESTTNPTLVFSKTGTYTVEYWSVDNNGNVEATHSTSFEVLTRPSGNTPSKPILPYSIKKSVSFRTWGYVKLHAAGTYPVSLSFYRLKSGTYVLYKTYTAKAYTIAVPGTDFSKYLQTKVSLPYTGTWRVRAKHVSGGKSYYSSYTTFTVK